MRVVRIQSLAEDPQIVGRQLSDLRFGSICNDDYQPILVRSVDEKLRHDSNITAIKVGASVVVILQCWRIRSLLIFEI